MRKDAKLKARDDADAEAAYYVESGYVDCRESHSDPMWGAK